MEREDIIMAIAEYHEDMDLAVAEIALDYAVQRRMEDMAHKHVQDSSVSYGRVSRGGAFLYPDGWKYKDYKNLKPLFQKTDHLPIFGSQTIGSHNEEKPTTHLIGFSTNWKYDDKNEDIFGYNYYFDDLKNLSGLKNPVDLPQSIKFDDAGHGNQQILTGLHHLAVSLNKLEDDRCGLEGGKACTTSPVGDYIKPMEATESADGSIANAEDTASSDNKTGYQKLKKSEISKEATDMTNEDTTKKKTSPGAGKPTPNKNEIGTYVENCANGAQTEEECKMQQKREERTGKWDGEVSGKMGKDLEELDITLEDLTALIEDNDDLKALLKDKEAELEKNKKETSDLETKVDKLIKWQEKALTVEKERQDGELETLKKDLVDNHKTCDKFIENHNTYDFLTEFHKGLPEPESEKEDLAEDEIDGVIPTSLAALGKKLDQVKEDFAYMKMS